MPRLSGTPSHLYTTLAAGKVISAVPLESVNWSEAVCVRTTARGAMAETMVLLS